MVHTVVLPIWLIDGILVLLICMGLMVQWYVHIYRIGGPMVHSTAHMYGVDGPMVCTTVHIYRIGGPMGT